MDEMIIIIGKGLAIRIIYLHELDVDIQQDGKISEEYNCMLLSATIENPVTLYRDDP